MPSDICNAAGTQVNRLALGTVQFGLNYGIANQLGRVTNDDAAAIIKLAGASGMNTLDTAISYGDSEQRLGLLDIHDWRIVSKLPALPEKCSDISRWVAEAVDGSLQRLQVKRLYGLLLHRPLQLLEKAGDQLYAALECLKTDRLVQKIGISIYDPGELDALNDRFQFDLVQAPFNILDRRLIDTGWLYRFAEEGTELHVRSVFLQGLLLMEPGKRPRQFDRWSDLWSQWDEWLGHTGLTPLEACLRYTLSFSQISKVVVGIDSLTQLEDVLLASAGQPIEIPHRLRATDVDLLNPAEWARLS